MRAIVQQIRAGKLLSDEFVRCCGKGQIAVAQMMLDAGTNPDTPTSDTAEPALTAASAQRHIDEISVLLYEGADVDATSTAFDWTPLMVSKNSEVMQLLLSSGANVHAQTEIGCTALHVIVANKNIEENQLLLMMQLLLAHGANIDAEDDAADTTLICAISLLASVACLRLLIDGGADINHNNGRVLLVACRVGNVAAVELLLSVGVVLTACDQNGNTALMTICWKCAASWNNNIVVGKQLAIMRILLKAGADATVGNDSNECTPLDAAFFIPSGWCRRAMVKLLVSAGASINQPNQYGLTALTNACSMINSQSLDHILIHGADVNAKDREGNTPLLAALDSVKCCADHPDSYTPEECRQQLEKVELLIDRGADLRAGNDKEMTTALDVAFSIDSEEYCSTAVRLLVDAGADINRMTQYRHTVLTNAVQNASLNTVERVLASGANVDSKDADENTALIVAVVMINDLDPKKQKHAKLFTALISKISALIVFHADVRIQNGRSLSAMDYALLINDASYFAAVLKLLVDAGADVNRPNLHNVTALMRSCSNANSEAVRYLISAGADLNIRGPGGVTALIMTCCTLDGLFSNSTAMSGAAGDAVDYFAEQLIVVLKLLIDGGADQTISAVVSDDNVTAFDITKRIANTKFRSTAVELLNNSIGASSVSMA